MFKLFNVQYYVYNVFDVITFLLIMSIKFNITKYCQLKLDLVIE